MFQNEGERKFEHLGPDYLFRYTHILVFTHIIHLSFIADRNHEVKLEPIAKSVEQKEQ